MGKQRLEQSWQRMVSQIQSVWGDIGEQDLKKARGNLVQMVDLIHEKTGEDRGVIMQKITTLI